MIVCASCVGVKTARPLEMTDMATEWLGVCGVETFYLKLNMNGTGTCVYMLPDAANGAVSAITHWSMHKGKIAISCTGLTYADETISITGDTESIEIKATINGKNSACTWSASGSLWRVDLLSHGLTLGREGAKTR